MLTLALALASVLGLLGYIVYNLLTFSKPVEKPAVLIFEWHGRQAEVSSARLVEWLCIRQILGEEWPPMADLLKARFLVGEPTTELELRREVRDNVDRVRRALERGDEALL